MIVQQFSSKNLCFKRLGTSEEKPRFDRWCRAKTESRIIQRHWHSITCSSSRCSQNVTNAMCCQTNFLSILIVLEAYFETKMALIMKHKSSSALIRSQVPRQNVLELVLGVQTTQFWRCRFGKKSLEGRFPYTSEPTKLAKPYICWFLHKWRPARDPHTWFTY